MSPPRRKSAPRAAGPRSTGDSADPGSERFVPEEFGPLPGYEHAHRYLAASILFGSGRVLDLASGSGAGTAMLRAASQLDGEKSTRAKRGQPLVIGLDLDLESARRAAPSVQADAVRLPFGDSSFDGVVCFETIEHLAEPARLLNEIERVLHKNGIALLSTPNREVFTARAGRDNPFHVSEMNGDEFLATLRASFSHVALFAQSVWSGSWLAALDEDGTALTAPTRRSWRIASRDLAPADDPALAPWADREDPRVPYPLYHVAICASSAGALERARRTLGANHLLHDRAQWLLGHYLTSLEGLTSRDAETESQAAHGRNLQRRLDQSTERVLALEAHATNLEAGQTPMLIQLEDLKRHASGLEELESNARERVARLEEHTKNLTVEIAERGKRADAAFEHGINLEAERSSLENRIEQLEFHGDNLESELRARTTHAENLEVELDARTAHAGNLEVELEAQTTHAQNLQADHDPLRHRVSELETHIRNLGTELETQRAHASNLEVEQIPMSRRVTELEGHARNLEIELAGRAAHASNLEAEIGPKEHRIEELEKHARNLETELEGRSAHARNLEAELAPLERRAVELQARARQLEGKLEVEAERASRLDDSITIETERTEGLAEEVTRLKTSRNAWRARAESSKTELEGIRASHTVRLVSWLRERLRG